MTMLSRATFVFLFATSVSVGTLSCGASGGGVVDGKGGSGGDKSGGSTGTSGGAGGSSVGGSGGSASGGGGGNAGSGGSARTGGSGGSASGGRAGAGGSAGGSGGAGGSANGGNAGGTSGGGGSAVGGTGGSSGVPGRTDGGPDAGRDVGADRGSDLGRDTTPVPDAPPVDDGGSCPNGQSACGSNCYDLTSSTSHCGGCTTVCGSGQSCVGGACVEGGTTASDGCTDSPATNLTLKQISVYQSVDVPIMQDGNEVAAASRNAAVVAGRNAMFRVFVTPGSGWTARALSARLTLTPAGGSPTTYYSRKNISAASVASDLASTFQVYVPPSAMTAPLTYSLQVVECSAQSGTAGAARFPATGDIDLGVKNTGGLKIKVIPLSYNNILPDTSATALAGYADYMVAMYPAANNVSMTVGDTLTVPQPIDWNGMLDQVQSKRSTDKPANDVYYFGLVKPADSLRTYCGSSCTTGIGFVVSSATGSYSATSRAAVGVAFADSTSAQTMAHEVGHNHGRNHSPCPTGAGAPAGIDAKYPYSGALIGVWGWDFRTQKLFDPAKITDIMGYCNSKWISDYTYSGLVTRVAAVNGVTMTYTPEPLAVGLWRALWVSDDRAPKWGIPVTEPSPATGDPEAATVYDSAGRAIGTVTVYRTLIGDTANGARVLVPEPQPGWFAVGVAGASVTPF